MHKSVMLKEVISLLQPSEGEVFFDGTLGGCGHALKIAEKIGISGKLVGVDLDKDVVAGSAKEKLGKFWDNSIVEHAGFEQISLIAKENNIKGFDGVLLDLGISSIQLDNPDRGLSFMRSGPLDMRLDITSGESLASKLDNTTVAELAKVIKSYGEQPGSQRIAKAIIESRKSNKLNSTLDLAEIIVSCVGYRKNNEHHPATRTFQSLRIWVNKELERLNKFLKVLPGVLNPGARVGVISFHSLEDRIVKRRFKELSKPCICPPKMPCICKGIAKFELITKKPARPDEGEISKNPRARSAKFRVAKRK